MTKGVQPEVDVLGNIYAHWQAGCVIPIGDTDAEGNAIDISGAPWVFVIPGLRKSLATDPENPLGRLLILSKQELQDHVPVGGVDFIVLDETDPAIPDPRWEGRIFPRGWK